MLCFIYMLVVSAVNACFPFLVRGYEPGGTTIFGLAVLFVAQFASLILLGYLKPLWFGVIPAALSLTAHGHSWRYRWRFLQYTFMS